jgi:hypothetical protein
MPHAPKTAALEALAAGLLSEDGERRIRTHLSGCAVCREHFATIHVYRESQELILQSKPEVEGRPVDWNKMERALAREARAQVSVNARGASANDGRYPWLLGGAVAVAAAALLAISLASSWGAPRTEIAAQTVPSTSSGQSSSASERDPVESPQAVPATAVISMLAGSVQYAAPSREDGASEGGGSGALEIGQRILGGRLETSDTSQAQLVLEAPSTEPSGELMALAQVAVGPGSHLGVGDVEPLDAAGDDATRSVTAVLSRGRTTIDAFETSSRVIVLAGSYRIEIRAARCTIDLDRDPGESDDTTRVAVGATHPELGEVVVVSRDGTRRELSRDETWASRVVSETRPALAALPLAQIEGAVLSVTLPDAVRFEIGDDTFVGGPTLAMRVTPGPLSLRAYDAAGRAFRASVDVGPNGLALTPDRLEPLRARVTGFLPPEEITPVVRQSQRALQRCYEQAMRLHPSIQGGLFRARVTLDSQGQVRMVRLEAESGQPMPDESLEVCVRREAALWHFPSPGGPMSFDLPLRFTTRQ